MTRGQKSGYFKISLLSTCVRPANTFKNLRLYDTDNANFREIDSITVVPESIYTTLEESGKLNELTQALASGNMQEVFEARQELLQDTTSVRQGTCPTPESQQLFWKHSRIWTVREGRFDAELRVLVLVSASETVNQSSSDRSGANAKGENRMHEIICVTGTTDLLLSGLPSKTLLFHA